MVDRDFKLIEGKYEQVNDISMYYEEYGSGEPLILIHGGSGTVRTWDKQIPFFSQYFRVIVVDCRGQGKSSNPKGDFHYKEMAEDFVILIEKLGLENPIIFGWSDGAQIALEIAIKYPNLLKTIIAGGALLESSLDLKEGMKYIGIEGPGKINFEHLKKTVPGFVKMLQEVHSSVYGENYWKTLLENITKMWFNPDEYPGETVKEIIIPTLILQGDRDEYISLSEATTLHKLIKNSELAIIPNATHECFLKRAELFNNIALDFLLRQQIK